MTAPTVRTVLRPIAKRSVLHRRRPSIRSISQRYFSEEYRRFLLFEVLIFVILAAMALWPIINAADFIRTYLL